MEASIEHIKREHHGIWPRILLAMPSFWPAVGNTYQTGRLDGSLESLKRDFQAERAEVEAICFPLCHQDHWIMIVVSFKDQEIKFAQGLAKRCPPLDMGMKIGDMLRKHFKIDISEWKNEYVELKSPMQKDHHSCGILTLALIESFCTGITVDYNEKDVDDHRIKWLRKCLHRHLNVIKIPNQQSLALKLLVSTAVFSIPHCSLHHTPSLLRQSLLSQRLSAEAITRITQLPPTLPMTYRSSTLTRH